ISCVAEVDVAAKPANTSSFHVFCGVIAVTAAPLSRSTVDINTSEFLCKLRDAIPFLLIRLVYRLSLIVPQLIHKELLNLHLGLYYLLLYLVYPYQGYLLVNK